MKITADGRVTIPRCIRERHGLKPYTEVEFRTERGRLYLIELEDARGRGRTIVGRMRGTLRSSLSTDELMKLTRE